ncbi:MAG TPA: pirin family protein [Actinomycetes bacterium]|nr:pirin family protein [Actinomycetes bacterium]
MSNLERRPVEAVGGGRSAVADAPVRELLSGREVQIGPRNTLVTRTLPHRERRMVGAWCYLDHYGPEDISGTPGMRVPPHPHTGLQTVSWLVQGRVLHRDSLGSEQLIQPGQLNLMTAGRGISHSEESARGAPALLHGVQLWVALPDRHRAVEPDFAHLPELPIADGGAGFGSSSRVTVIMGELAGAVSPARTYSPLIGAEVALDADGSIMVPLRPGFEHAVLPLTGSAVVDEVPLAPGPLLYLGTGRTELEMRNDGPEPARLLLLGGEPFDEQIIMWWNFVGRSHDEIVRMRSGWMDGDEFGTVRGYDGDPLPAPPMPATTLKPRPRTR